VSGVCRGPTLAQQHPRAAPDVERCLHGLGRQMVLRKGSPHSSRGFTLVELMTVVAIVSIIAVIGMAAVRNRVFGSKATEAFAMMQSIRVAEERWKAENLQYLDASPSGNWFPADPRGDAKATKRNFFVSPGQHTDAALWATLRPVAPGPVEFGYLVNAGTPSTAMRVPAVTSIEWPPPCNATTAPPACNGEHWYVIQAIADLDHDGVPAYVLASHLKGDIFRLNEGE
jgi:prepilin-type N-terminal cleavage/methylation domain-containing protein